ncbi:MAG TPA: diacylglycerol kinase family protein [Actinomycetes bacterium]|nr:diacylglycerol kinase family protein [Actinomycetes bacterium]
MTAIAACVAASGSGDWEALAEALAVLRKRFGRVPVYPVSSPGEAEAAVRDLAGGIEALLVYGGDGTLNQVVNGLPLPPSAAPAVGLLAGGSGNDVVRGLGLSPDPVTAAHAVADGRPVELDLLDCDGQRAANGVNAGFAAAASEVLSRRAKVLLGRTAYTLGGVVAAVRLPHWPVWVQVGSDLWEGEALAVVVGNGPSFGGGRTLLPGADPADGALDATVVPLATPRGELLRALARNRLPEGLPRFAGPAARISTPMPCQLDGEAVPTPRAVSVLPRAWRVLLPRA